MLIARLITTTFVSDFPVSQEARKRSYIQMM